MSQVNVKEQEKWGPSLKSEVEPGHREKEKGQSIETYAWSFLRHVPECLYYLNVSKWLADILSNPKSP